MGKFECDNCVRLQAEFVAFVERTQKRIKGLEEKLGKNSSNSSLPPWTNPPGSKKPVVKKSTGPVARCPAGSAIPAFLSIPAEPVAGCRPSFSQVLPRVRGSLPKASGGAGACGFAARRRAVDIGRRW